MFKYLQRLLSCGFQLRPLRPLSLIRLHKTSLGSGHLAARSNFPGCGQGVAAVPIYICSCPSLVSPKCSTFSLHQISSHLHYSHTAAMPYQLRDSTSVPNAEPTPSSAASSVTVEHNKDAPDELPFKGLGTNYLQKGFSGSAKPVAGEFRALRIGIIGLM